MILIGVGVVKYLIFLVFFGGGGVIRPNSWGLCRLLPFCRAPPLNQLNTKFLYEFLRVKLILIKYKIY
jgi:hypothetical protein